MIIPYLIVLSAIGMFRASGGLEMMVGWIEPVTSMINLRRGASTCALRPLSGSVLLVSPIVPDLRSDSYIAILLRR